MTFDFQIAYKISKQEVKAMKNKKLILLPVLSLVVTGCTQDPSLTESVESASSSSAPFSSSESSVYSDNSDVSSVTGTNSIDESVERSITIDENGVTQYRDPSNLNHEIPYNLYTTENFINFKKKMQYFSNKLTDICVRKYSKYNSNFVISPLSIEMCLGLAIRAAEGDTRDEILEAFDMDYATFNTNYKLFYNYLEGTTKNYSGGIISQLLLANSIWIDDGIELKDAGLDALRDDYYCYSYGVDFDGKNAEANEAIREFIHQNTKGKINPHMDLSPDTLFVLLNTLYSKGLWYEDGHDLASAPITYKFTNQDGTLSNKRLLDGKYYSGKPIVTDSFSAFFTCLYGYRIYFVKPNDGNNLSELFDKKAMKYVLDDANIIEQDDTLMERYRTKCIFPEFSAYSEIDLNEPLSDLGIESLFKGGYCNMGALTDESVYCSDMKHIASLDVTKKGMEGAAVTYSAMAGAGAPQPDPYTYVRFTFEVTKEFGFIVTSGSGNNVIFSGVVNNIDG